MTSTDVVPYETETGLVNVEGALADWQAYQELTRKLLNETDYQNIGQRSFKKKSAWRKYAKAFNLSCEIVEKNIERDDQGCIVYADFVMRATAPSGRSTEAWASCSRSERSFSHDQDIAATAQTRAENRAISDLIGAGEMSAEEALDEKTDQRARRPAPPRPLASDATPTPQGHATASTAPQAPLIDINPAEFHTVGDLLNAALKALGLAKFEVLQRLAVSKAEDIHDYQAAWRILTGAPPTASE